jgi:hypothetical protein
MAWLATLISYTLYRVGDMRLSSIKPFILPFLLGCITMYIVLRVTKTSEGFRDECPECPPSNDRCPPMPDLSKYVLKTSIPPCPTSADMTNYMLKSECPPVPDLSQYVLKTSVPKQQPIIIDTSEDRKAKCGDCPPCPRPRCPEIKCPPPTACPAPAPCPRAVCPQTTVKCRAQEIDTSPVRPFLAPLGMSGFGQS